MKKKKLGIYSLLCVLVLWIFPEITAAFCTEFVALLKNHSHVHPGGASGDEDHHDAAPVDADACCLQIFAGGAGEFILTASSLLVKPVLSGEVATSQAVSRRCSCRIFYIRPISILAHLKIPSGGLQGPLYALFSTYLI